MNNWMTPAKTKHTVFQVLTNVFHHKRGCSWAFGSENCTGGLFHSSGGSVAQWLARQTLDPAVAGGIPTTAHVAIALGKHFTSVHPSSKWYPAIGS